MTDTNGLLRAAGGPRPKDDLIQELETFSCTPRAEILCCKAAAELTRLQGRVAALEAENARLTGKLREMTSDRDSWEQQNDDRVSDVLAQATRAERAEAERDAAEKNEKNMADALAACALERDALREMLTDHEKLWREQYAKQTAVIEAAKAMRRYPTHENSYGRDFDAALAALEGDK